MSRYQYQPLDPEAKTIRLMRLLPGSFEDEICVSLGTTVLRGDRIPKYEALSYAWGSTTDRVAISVATHRHLVLLKKWTLIIKRREGVDGQLDVTQNLAVALRHLRLRDRNRDLWIDAICVDQENLDERGHQVERMADIYRNAKQVIAWVGPEGDNSTLAMETLASLGSRLKVGWDAKAKALISTWPEDTDLTDLDIALPYNANTWGSIRFLLSRSWFKRLWVWQEMLLARSASLQCGYRSIGWSSFGKAILCIYLKPRPSHPDLTVLDHIYNFVFARAWRYNLHILLYQTRNCEYSDPRDRIYALLNIVHQGDSAVGLQPDYNQTPRRVFQDVVLRSLSNVGKLDLISHCEWNTNLVERPSWVPDFSKSRISNHIPWVRCCLGSKAEAEYAGNGILNATGMCAAEISGIEKITLDKEAWSDTTEVELAIQRLMRQVDLDVLYIDGSDMIDALCRTLCMDKFTQFFTPPRPEPPNLETALQYLRRLCDTSQRKFDPDNRYLYAIANYMKGRHFFTTKQGYIGLSPEAGKIGDQICVVLGCQFPLLLRRMKSGNLAVIGDCYIHGLMNGEALLGTLPSKWQYSIIRTADSGYQHGFVDQETGDRIFEDPRLGELPPGWRFKDPKAPVDWNNWFINDETGERLKWPIDPRMTADALRDRGVPLQKFELE
ncbi:MAG: hypothetical protein Q9184_004992 [Pyrenodesmia sp. 2 TL-2023]